MKKRKRGRPVTKGTKLKNGLIKMKIKCSICGIKRHINTTTPDLYSKEVVSTYICLLCKSKGSEK